MFGGRRVCLKVFKEEVINQSDFLSLAGVSVRRMNTRESRDDICTILICSANEKPDKLIPPHPI